LFNRKETILLPWNIKTEKGKKVGRMQSFGPKLWAAKRESRRLHAKKLLCDETAENLSSSARFFPTYIPVFEIRANNYSS